jgi:hypothetical protein
LPELDAADLQEQSTIYLRERNRTMKLKRTKAELELGVARDRLIERELVLKQLAYLLVAMRQKLLALPSKLNPSFATGAVDSPPRLINTRPASKGLHYKEARDGRGSSERRDVILGGL